MTSINADDVATKALEIRLAVLEAKHNDFQVAVMEKLDSMVKLAARPSWPIVAFITAESAVIAGLLGSLVRLH